MQLPWLGASRVMPVVVLRVLLACLCTGQCIAACSIVSAEGSLRLCIQFLLLPEFQGCGCTQRQTIKFPLRRLACILLLQAACHGFL